MLLSLVLLNTKYLVPHGGYSSVAERQTVALDVVGSTPTTHPNFPLYIQSLAKSHVQSMSNKESPELELLLPGR